MPARGTTITILAASIALAGGLAACGSDAAPAPGPTVTSTVTETATVTATPTTSTSPSASPSASATTASAGCASSEVSAKIVGGDSGAGQRRGTLVLTNTGTRRCTVLGYAGMQLLAANGSNIPTKVVRVASPAPKSVQVKPGGKASATLTWGVVPSGNESQSGACEKTATSAKVTPPNSTTSVRATWNLGPVCNDGRIQTNAFVAGSQG